MVKMLLKRISLLFLILLITTPFALAKDIRLSLVDYEPRPVIPGSFFTITFKAENIADKDLDNVLFEIDPGDDFFIDGNDDLELDINKDESEEFSFIIGVEGDAKTGFEDLELKYKTSTDKDSEDFKIQIKAIEPTLQILEVNSTPEKIMPGQEAEVSLKIKNLANFDLKDIIVKLDLSSDIPFAPLKSVTEKRIDSLRENEIKEITFKVIALSDAASKIYKIPLITNYFDEFGAPYNTSNVISLTISSPPELDVTVEESKLIFNKKSSVIINLVNFGLSDIQFLNVNLEPSKDFIPLSTTTIYIGDVDSDDTETLEFELIPLKENSLKLPLEITYKDSNNIGHKENINLNVRVYSEEEAKKISLIKTSNFTLILIIIVILLIIYFIYRKSRRRR